MILTMGITGCDLDIDPIFTIITQSRGMTHTFYDWVRDVLGMPACSQPHKLTLPHSLVNIHAIGHGYVGSEF